MEKEYNRSNEEIFNNSLAEMRQDYGKEDTSSLFEAKDPHALFLTWFADAIERAVLEPNAMTLATSSLQGQPSARTVLLKGYEDRSFVFYTNLQSRKASELKCNPFATLLFFWAKVQRQICIEGVVEPVGEEKASEYFNGRPRGSQLGAWTSQQGKEIKNWKELEEGFAKVSQFFEGKVITKPPYWGGFRLIPQRFEFWQGRSNRLHQRVEFRLDGEGGWSSRYLSP